jgi:Rad3-related DNA helicase
LVERRFKNRPIFGLVDGPILRIDPQFPDAYKLARAEANEIISSILPSFERPVLILCRNSKDARSISSHLQSIKRVSHRLYLFEDESSLLEIDAVETKINKEIEAGRDIVVTTASSRLWEGVNLKHLRLLIVDALPYPSSQPYEKFEKGTWGSWRTSRTFRFMIRRIQQGIGRLIRTEEDPWGLVVVVDGRFNAQWNTIKSALPLYMTSPEIIKFITRDNLKDELEEKIQKLEKLGHVLITHKMGPARAGGGE